MNREYDTRTQILRKLATQLLAKIREVEEQLINLKQLVAELEHAIHLRSFAAMRASSPLNSPVDQKTDLKPQSKPPPIATDSANAKNENDENSPFADEFPQVKIEMTDVVSVPRSAI